MGQGQGREQLPFDIGPKFESLSEKSIWSVHSGRRKVSLAVLKSVAASQTMVFVAGRRRRACDSVCVRPHKQVARRSESEEGFRILKLRCVYMVDLTPILNKAHHCPITHQIKLAQSAHLRLKTLRHPNVLRYIDGVELPTCIYVVTEEAMPLEDHMTTKEGHSEFSTAWGLHQIIVSQLLLLPC